MNVGELLEVAAPALGNRPMVVDREVTMTAADLLDAARSVAAWLTDLGVESLAMVDLNSRAVPIGLYGAAVAGVPFTPISYRLPDDRLRALVARTAPSAVVAGEGVAERMGEIDGVAVVSRDELLDRAAQGRTAPGGAGASEAAVVLFTSGTTGEPKAAALGHSNLTSYVLSTIEFASAAEDEAALVSVPPYHIAGVMAALTNVFCGRTIVYLEAFDAGDWVEAAVEHRVTHAMVVPTMLARILDELELRGVELPGLRLLSYGGGPMPVRVIERALDALPGTDFVNAYGLTETASTVTILGPDDHREAHASDDPARRRRLASVGTPLPTVELTIRDESRDVLPVGERGEVWVRGDQVSGTDDAGGWFRTRDAGELDADGFLYLHGRLDDVIVRGGENLSPAEIEEVLRRDDAVADCAVVGIPDERWGERVVAAVVPAEGATVDAGRLQAAVRAELRSTATPEDIVIRTELPVNELGKLLRRELRAELTAELSEPG